MWDRISGSAEAQSFDDAVVGKPSTPDAEELAAFVASVADAVRPPAPFVSERGWQRLQEALHEPRESSGVVRGALAPARSTAILGAAMAGGGLLVAGAASGVDPALVVRQVIIDMPSGPWASQNPVPAAATDLIVEGMVTAAGSDQIELETDSAQVTIRLDGRTRIEAMDGSARRTTVTIGDRVRVRARLSTEGALVATTVVLYPGQRPPAGMTTPGAAMVQRAPETPSAAPSNAVTPRAAVTGVPVPRGTAVRQGDEGPAPASDPASPDARVEGADLSGAAPPPTEPTRTPVAAVTATVPGEPTRTPEPAAALATRSPEPTKPAATATPPDASTSPAPVDTPTPRTPSPTVSPAPVEPAPTVSTGTPIATPTPKKTPVPVSDSGRDSKNDVPGVETGGVAVR